MESLEHLSELQRQDLDILKEFVRICEEKGFRYYLVAGSMLGAVRHRGFIPWDDDIDVAMPRKDYDAFLEVAPGLLPEKYRLETPRQREHVTIVSTIVSNEGGFTLNNASKVQSTGAWIDIMMIDGVPNPGLKRRLHWFHYLFLRALYQISHFNEVVDRNRERPGFEKLIISFASATNMQRILNPTKVNHRIERLMRRFDYDSCEYVATYCGIYRDREIVPKSWYGEGADYPFENMTAKGLADADAYLTQIYGDYMTPPQDTSSKHNVKREQD